MTRLLAIELLPNLSPPANNTSDISELTSSVPLFVELSRCCCCRSSAETEGRASSSSLCGAVILSSRWSSAAVPRSRDARIPQPRADRRSAGILRAALRWRDATQYGQSLHRDSDHLS